MDGRDGRMKCAWLMAWVLGSLLVLGCAAAAASSGAAAGTAQLGSAPARQPIQLVFPLKATAAGLGALALAVNDPTAPQYGHFESIASLARRFGASKQTRTRVLAYLRRAGATAVKLDATGLFADATIEAGLAERLFGTPISRFRVARDAGFLAPTAPVGLPSGLRGLVDGVIGLDTRPVLRAPRPEGQLRASLARAHASAAQPASGYEPLSGSASGCSGALGTGAFTPNQYLSAYDYGPLRSAGRGGQGERVALIEIDGFRRSDILTFAHCFGLSLPAITGYGVGLKRPLAPGGEATLDLEVLDAAAPALKAIDVYESRPGPADALRALTAPLQVPGSKPQVISASLGLCEQALVSSIGAAGINATEAALQMAAASGITFLSASGDSGSADCVDQAGRPQDRLAVNYPASSWWATGVGGTNFTLNGSNQITEQLVWNDAAVLPGSAGGGGFSIGFRRPPYQRGAVAANRRAVPDVSMLADVAPGYSIYCTAAPDCVNSQNSSAWSSFGGTSAATPLLAGGLALVDQELRLHGRTALGFVNPLLYQIGRSAFRGEVFLDVTQFGNDVGSFIPGSGQPLGCCSAAAGFDAATGWGGIDLAHLAAFAVALQPTIVKLKLSLPRSQRPVENRGILATVSCSGACRLAAAATITIAHSKPFFVRSGVYRLRSRGRKTISLAFSAAQLRKLRSALAAHRRVLAEITGVIVDSTGAIEQRTRGRRVAIRS